MSSFSSAQTDLKRLSVRFNQFQREFDRLQTAVDNGAGVSAIAPAVLRLREGIEVRLAELKFLQDVTIPDITDATDNAILALYNEAGALRDRYNDLLDSTFDLTKQAAENDNNRSLTNNQPANSSSDIVEEDKNAAEEDSRVSNPPAQTQILNNDGDVVTPPDAQGAPTNARKPELRNDSDLGDNGGVSQAQGSTPVVKGRITQNGGAVSNTDDAYEPVDNSRASARQDNERPVIAPEFLNQIIPADNPLQGLASQTYTISIYMMTAAEFRTLLVRQRKVLPSNRLIVQSGGIPFGQRDPDFDVDFYIEDVELRSVVGTQAIGSIHNAVDLSFTILEPQGITFLNRLQRATKRYTGKQNASETSQNYLMVIRFYGYDDGGNLISGSDLNKTETTSDPNSLVEKFIPFQIADIKYKITTKATEYRVTATIPQTNIGFSQSRATIPFNIELVASDVQTLLNGSLLVRDQQREQTDEEAFAELEGNAPPRLGLQGATITQGLCDALNKHQRLLAEKRGYKIADEYEIVLEDVPGLKDAKLAKPGRQNKKRAPMNLSQQAADRYLQSKSSYNKESKTYSITAGMQIVQLLELVMRSSSYITSQQNIAIDEKTGAIIEQQPVETVLWFRVRCQVTPIDYDDNRNDYAYKIKYTISRYKINTPRSAYFPPAAYRGVHKLYNYWFTGQNTEVLDFEINVNANYAMTVGNDALIPENTASGRWFEKRFFQTRPNASSQGGEGESTMPAANLAERLYGPEDVATGEIKIIGDPDWIQQGEVFYNDSVILTPFLADGSLNFDASEVLYELRFNPVVDYDLETGLTPVYRNNTTYSQITGEVNLAQESIVWCAAEVFSYFKDGAFTQRINGTIRDFSTAVNAPVTETGGIQVEIITDDQETPRPQRTESGGARPADINNVTGATSLDVAGGTVVEEDLGFFDVDDDAGIAISP